MSHVLTTISNVAGSAALQGNQTYAPYGTKRYSSGSMGTSKGYTGQYQDTLTGLDYYNARYYDPVAGIFLSADTVQGDMQGMDPFAYVGGNPETMSDPTGHRIYCPGCQMGGGGDEDSRQKTTSSTPWNYAWTGGTPSCNRLGCYRANNSGNGSNTQQSSHPQPKNVFQQGWGWITHQWDRAKDNYSLNSAFATDPTLACGAFLSFKAATKVSTSKGAKAIVSLRAGDKVWAYNIKIHKMELQPIQHVWINHDDDLVDLTITTIVSKYRGKLIAKKKEVIHTTQKHPFLTPDKGFVPVRVLHIGSQVVNADGNIGIITHWESIFGVMTMYNLEVAQDHTFTVGDGQWVVHNCGSGFDDTGDINLNGATYEEIIARIPTDIRDQYEVLPPQEGGAQLGLRWRWKTLDGVTHEVRLHSADPNAPIGSNARSGWTLRVLQRGMNAGKRMMTGDGRWVKQRGPSATEAEKNDAHIPIENQTEDPTSPLFGADDPIIETP